MPEQVAFKSVVKQVLSREQVDGDGARVRRSIGTEELRNLDPFLMLDEFSVMAPAGFPDHPHRGQLLHEDFTGRTGTINPGDLQWMTAGRGIVHAEMPLPGVLCRGLQLWINLPAKHKMTEPRYQELKDEDVPRAGSHCGREFGVKAEVKTFTPIFYLDVKVEKGGMGVQNIPAGYTTFVYTLAGSTKFEEDGNPVGPHTTVVFSKDGDAVLSFCIDRGQPIGEKIVQYGPFVMNEQAEIHQAFDDYRSGQNGFEHADGWSSEIGH
ncbi:RmlC-like cupin domain-containing protein [Chytridium lagenaria]|nr:RmlC-like cupin domain-containing protein [Chytridium lagenaria]